MTGNELISELHKLQSSPGGQQLLNIEINFCNWEGALEELLRIEYDRDNDIVVIIGA